MTKYCQRCNQYFSGQQALQQHLNSPAHTPVYDCENCDRSFGSQQSFNRYLNSPTHAPSIRVLPSATSHFEANNLSINISTPQITLGSEQSREQLFNSPRHNFEMRLVL